MFLSATMPSTASVFSAYTAFTASAVLVSSMISQTQAMTSQLIPQMLRHTISAKFTAIFASSTSQMNILIEENNGSAINDLYRAAEIYLRTRFPPSLRQLKASKAPGEKSLSFKMNKGETIKDVFEGVEITWEFVSVEKHSTYFDFDNCAQTSETKELRHYQLSFHKRHREMVMNAYLPFVLEKSKAIEEEKKVVKLHASCGGYVNGDSVVLEHSCTFDALAMDPMKKKELIDDLDRFMRRKDFYRRLGKPWKRGYLLYGPPGTGKSSLVAAMANYLKFDVYDLELASVRSNSALRTMLLSTANRSIIVIEDIDCSIELHDRQNGEYNPNDSQLTLSGVLNVIDGLWSSCGDARIIVFTTNHKEKLDPALLRPGRMDMHIHMSYLNPSGFEILASNYLQIQTHHRFKEIEEVIMEMEVTPAEIAEELMKSDDADVALEAVDEFLRAKKKLKIDKESDSDVVAANEKEEETRDIKEEAPKAQKRNKRRRTGRRKGW